jgi:hypothetical protein
MGFCAGDADGRVRSSSLADAIGDLAPTPLKGQPSSRSGSVRSLDRRHQQLFVQRPDGARVDDLDLDPFGGQPAAASAPSPS